MFTGRADFPSNYILKELGAAKDGIEEYLRLIESIQRVSYEDNYDKNQILKVLRNINKNKLILIDYDTLKAMIIRDINGIKGDYNKVIDAIKFYNDIWRSVNRATIQDYIDNIILARKILPDAFIRCDNPEAPRVSKDIIEGLIESKEAFQKYKIPALDYN